MKSYFFDAERVPESTEHPSGYDREYHAVDHALFAQSLTTNGVFGYIDADACKAGIDGTAVSFVPGAIAVEGHQCVLEAADRVDLAGKESGYYTIVCRLNRSAPKRAFELFAEFGTTDEMLEPVRAGDIYDMLLARCHYDGHLTVSAMTDLRQMADVCGFANMPMPTQYGICATPAGDPIKIVMAPGFTLRAGRVMAVTFTAGDISTGPTMDVNDTGIYPLESVEIGAGMTVAMVFTGEKWTALVMRSPAVPVGTEITSLATLDMGGIEGTWLPLDGRTITAAAYPALVELAQNYYPRVLSQAAISQTFTVQPRWTARFAWFYGRDDGMVYQINKEGSAFMVRRNNAIIGEFAHNFGETLSVIFETKTCFFVWIWNSSNGYIYRATDKANPTWEQVGAATNTGGFYTAGSVLVDYEGDSLLILGEMSGGNIGINKFTRTGITRVTVASFGTSSVHVSVINGRMFTMSPTGTVLGEILTNAAGAITGYTTAPANLPIILSVGLRRIVRCANGRYMTVPRTTGQTYVFEPDGETVANIFTGKVPGTYTLWTAFAWGNTMVILEEGGILTMVAQDGRTFNLTALNGSTEIVLNALGSYASNLDGLYDADNLVASGLDGSTRRTYKTTVSANSIKLPGKPNGFVRAL